MKQEITDEQVRMVAEALECSREESRAALETKSLESDPLMKELSSASTSNDAVEIGLKANRAHSEVERHAFERALVLATTEAEIKRVYRLAFSKKCAHVRTRAAHKMLAVLRARDTKK